MSLHVDVDAEGRLCRGNRCFNFDVRPLNAQGMVGLCGNIVPERMDGD
jgi:hypothetical protein